MSVRPILLGCALLPYTSLYPLVISPVPLDDAPAPDTAITAEHLECDDGGTTSFRFIRGDRFIQDNKFAGAPASINRNPIAGPEVPKVAHRDRDLGQSFIAKASGRVRDLWLRLGFTTNAVMAGGHGSELVVQWLQVEGDPVRDDSGTPGRLGRFDRLAAPELDDALIGERFVPLVHAIGRLPGSLTNGMVLRFAFASDESPVLATGGHYAVVVGFASPGADRSMALANQYYGSYTPDPSRPLVGHGLRREGGTGDPAAPWFRPALPGDLATRLAQPPGTMGFPDVCTWRDLWFRIAVAP